ncbi:MAG: hypothetical protein QM820_56240 [Minicystis sp.]
MPASSMLAYSGVTSGTARCGSTEGASCGRGQRAAALDVWSNVAITIAAPTMRATAGNVAGRRLTARPFP